LLDQDGFIADRGVIKSCSEPGCEGSHVTRGYCMTHYNKRRLSGQLPQRPKTSCCQFCSVDLPVPEKGPIPRICRTCKWKRDKKTTANQDRVLMKYGIKRADYDRLLAEQNGVCAICGGGPVGNGKRYGRLSVDHDHDSGIVRGLLCGTCNSGLGMFKDDAYICEAAADYLRNGPITSHWSE
jgi:hypothetical protein